MPGIRAYEDLVKALGNDYGKLKSETGWKDDKGNDVSFSNESGFSALPVGYLYYYRDKYELRFDGVIALFMSTDNKAYGIYVINFYYDEDGTSHSNNGSRYVSDALYLSVRCIMIENND